MCSASNFVLLNGYISYSDKVAMTYIAVLQVAALVKISGRLQFRHGMWFCALVCHWLC